MAGAQGSKEAEHTAGEDGVMAAARDYVRRGWGVVPVGRQSKAPLYAEWEARRYREDELAAAVPLGGNLGVLTGMAGGGLVDVDCDAPEAQRGAALLLLPTGLIHGRLGAPRSHYWYQATSAGEPSARIKSARYRFEEQSPAAASPARTMLVELRGDGCQTLVPPSVHPQGETLRWEEAGAPAQIAEGVLRAAVARVAACALLARCWPRPGQRDEAALALAGMLLDGGWDVEAADLFILAVARVASDEEWFRRGKAVATARRHAAGEPATGRHALAKLLRADGARVVRAAGEWLGLAPAHATGPHDAAYAAYEAISGESHIGTVGTANRTSGGEAHVLDAGHLVFTRLSQVREETLEWLWPGHLPLGVITMLDGDPGLGKSLVSLDLAARVVRGLPMPDGAPGMTGGVVLISAEDPLAAVIKPRLHAAGVAEEALLDRIIGLPVVKGGDPETGETYERALVLPGDTPVIAAAARSVEARLVVIDPLMAYLDPRKNSWRDQDMRAALAPLQRMAEELRLSVLILRHLNKSTGASALYRGSGSIGIIGAARAGWVMGRDPDDPEGGRVVAFRKNNLADDAPSLRVRVRPGPDGLPTMEWGDVSPYSADQLVNQPVAGTATGAPVGTTVIQRAMAWLTRALAEGPRPRAELIAAAADAGFTLDQLVKAGRRLAVQVKREGFGAAGRSLWSLPPDVADDPS